MSRFLREFQFLHFRRVPIYWHSSVCVGFVASALLTKSVMSGAVAFFAYLLLILAHEIGHAVAAQSLKIDVFSLHVSAVHGRCIFGDTENLRSHVAVAWGGVVAQFTVLIFAVILAYMLHSVPDAAKIILSAAFFVWIPLNILIMVINLLPLPGLDGYVAWRIFNLAGTQDPKSVHMSQPEEPGTVVETELARIAKKSRVS